MTKLAPLNLKITGSSGGLSAALGKSQRDISNFATGVNAKLASLAVPVGLTALAAKLVGLGADAEKSLLQMRTLLDGNAQAAENLRAQLKTFSETTPFEFTQVSAASRTLLAFGITAQELPQVLQTLGNVSAATGSQIEELARIFGQAKSTTVVYTDDLNQLSERGIPILDILAKRFGVTTAEVRKLASEGKVGFADLRAALESLGGPTGKWAGAMDELSKSLTGQLSTLKDKARELGETLGGYFVPRLAIATGKINEWATKGIASAKEFSNWLFGVSGETDGYSTQVAELANRFNALATEQDEFVESFNTSDLGEKLKKELLNPTEIYQQRLEELKQAFVEGGLNADFFSRGVRKAFEALDQFNRESGASSRPQTALRGSKEAADIIEKRGSEERINSQVENELRDANNRLRSAQDVAAKEQANKLAESSQKRVAAIVSLIDDATKQFEQARENVQRAAEELRTKAQESLNEFNSPKRLSVLGFGGSKMSREEFAKRIEPEASNVSRFSSEAAVLQRVIQEANKLLERQTEKDKSIESTGNGLLQEIKSELKGIKNSLTNLRTPTPVNI